LKIQLEFDHPNIVKTIHWFKEYFEKSDHGNEKYVRYCLVMEYEKNGSLMDQLKSSKIYSKDV